MASIGYLAFTPLPLHLFCLPFTEDDNHSSHRAPAHTDVRTSQSNQIDLCVLTIIRVPRPVVQGGMQWYEHRMLTLFHGDHPRFTS